MEKVIGSFIAIEFMLCGIMALDDALKGKNDIPMCRFYVWILTIPFAIKLTLTFLNTRMKKILNSPINHATSEDHIIIKLVDLYNSFTSKEVIHQKQNEKSWKFMFKNKHNEHPYKGLSINNTISDINEQTIDNKDHLVAENNIKMLFKLMSEIYDHGIKKFPNSILIRLIFLNYLTISKIISIKANLSIVLISQIYSIIHHKNFFIRINLIIAKSDDSQLKKSCNRDALTNDNLLNLREFIKITYTIHKILMSLKTGLLKYLSFWRKFNSKDCGNTTLLIDAYEANKQYEKIMEILKIIEDNKDHDHRLLLFSKPLLFASLFILTVKFSNSKSDKCIQLNHHIQKKFEKIKHIEILTNETLYAKNNIFLTISGAKEVIGKILNCTGSTEKHIGYESKALLGKNISIILPKSLQKRHNQYLMNFLYMGNSYILNTIRIAPVLHENQTISLMNIYTKASPTLEHGLLFLGMLRPNYSMNQIIIITYDGYIDSLSDHVREILGLTRDNIQISLLNNTEGYCLVHSVFNFMRFVDIIGRMGNKEVSRLRRICENYQNQVNLEVDIYKAYEEIKNKLNDLDNFNELRAAILKMPDYLKIKSIYDSLISEDITFKLIIDSNNYYTKKFSIQCTIEDQLYQDYEFTRLLRIKDIQTNTINKTSGSLGGVLQQRTNIDDIDTVDNIDMNAYIHEYKKYYKRTKNDLDICHYQSSNIIQREYTPNNKNNEAKDPTSLDYRMSSQMLKITINRLDTNKSRFIDNSKIMIDDDGGGGVDVIGEGEGGTNAGGIKFSTQKTQKIINILSLKSDEFTGNDQYYSKDRMITNQDDLDPLTSSTASNIFTMNYIEKKLDEAFSYVYISTLNKFLIVNLIVYSIIAIILGLRMFFNQIAIDNGFIQNSSAIYSWNMAYKRLMDISYVVKEIYCVQNSYIPNDLWGFAGLPDLLDYDIEYTANGVFILKDYLDDFSNDINSLQNDLKNQILKTPIRMVDIDPITFEVMQNYTTYDILKALYEIINKLIYVGSIPLDNKFQTITANIYIVNNVYGDMIIAQKSINDILFNAIMKEYNNLELENHIYYLILSAAGFFCLVMLIYQNYKYLKKQKQFFTNLIKLNSWKTYNIQRKIERLVEIFEMDILEENLRGLRKKIEIENKFDEGLNEKGKGNQHHQQQQQSFRINLGLIKKRNNIKFIIGFFFTASYVLIFVLSYFFLKIKKDENEVSIQRFLEILNRYSNSSLAVGLFYSYLANNGTGSFRNRNISRELDELYSAKANISHLRSLFLDSNPFPEYTQYLTGNACQIIDTSLESLCMQWGSQRAQYGILGMEEWLGNSLIFLKESFDASNRSREVINQYFKSDLFVNVIGIDFFIQIYAYNGLSAAIKRQIDNDIIKSQQSHTMFISFATIGLFITTSLFGFTLIWKICYEFIELKVLLKTFPISISLKHSYFKKFIRQTSKPVLENMENRL